MLKQQETWRLCTLREQYPLEESHILQKLEERTKKFNDINERKRLQKYVRDNIQPRDNIQLSSDIGIFAKRPF